MSRVCQQIFDLVVKETSLLPQSNHLRPWFPQQGAALSHPCPQCWWSSESHPSELSDKCKERCTEWCFQHECPKANPMACQWHLMENGRLPHLGNEVLTGHRYCEGKRGNGVLNQQRVLNRGVGGQFLFILLAPCFAWLTHQPSDSANKVCPRVPRALLGRRLVQGDARQLPKSHRNDPGAREANDSDHGEAYVCSVAHG